MKYLRFIRDVILSIIMIPFVLIGLILLILFGMGYFIIWWWRRLKREEKDRRFRKENYQ